MITGFLLLAVAIAFNGVANVLMKKGMSGGSTGETLGEMLQHYLTSWPVIIGLFLFALNIVAYTQALSRLPLAVAYPIMVSLSGVIVIAGSIFLFRETINWNQWAGFALIIAGVILVAK